MIVCSSNAWGGCLPNYVPYITDLARQADILCLQEVHKAHNIGVPERFMPKDPGGRTMPLNLHLFNQLKRELEAQFDCYFACQLHGYLHDIEATEHDVSYGNAMFVRKGIGSIVYSETMPYKRGEPANDGYTAAHKSAQATVIKQGFQHILISHTHGAWWTSNKGDVMPRREQFSNWSNWLSSLRARHGCTDAVLCGDFNQTSDTDLITLMPYWEVFGTTPGRNLNAHHGITNTRTQHYKKAIGEADYMYASPALDPVLTIDHEVPSDHATLICELQALDRSAV